jgi:hypothetical protein
MTFEELRQWGERVRQRAAAMVESARLSADMANRVATKAEARRRGSGNAVDDTPEVDDQAV